MDTVIKRGKIMYTHDMYTPELLQNNPELTFVFGDNFKYIGKGGQAIIRDEPNAFGIPTKLSPSQFMTDDLYRHSQVFKLALGSKFKTLEVLLKSGLSVVFPIDFIGTGLAELPERAPSMYAYIQHRANVLMHVFGTDMFEGKTNE